MDLDSAYSVAEFEMQLYGWTRDPRIAVVRELVKDKPSMGRRWFDIPEPCPLIEIRRDNNQRPDTQNRFPTSPKLDLAVQNDFP
jgi:hypothetical protein